MESRRGFLKTFGLGGAKAAVSTVLPVKEVPIIDHDAIVDGYLKGQRYSANHAWSVVRYFNLDRSLKNVVGRHGGYENARDKSHEIYQATSELTQMTAHLTELKCPNEKILFAGDENNPAITFGQWQEIFHAKKTAAEEGASTLRSVGKKAQKLWEALSKTPFSKLPHNYTKQTIKQIDLRETALEEMLRSRPQMLLDENIASVLNQDEKEIVKVLEDPGFQKHFQFSPKERALFEKKAEPLAHEVKTPFDIKKPEVVLEDEIAPARNQRSSGIYGDHPILFVENHLPVVLEKSVRFDEALNLFVTDLRPDMKKIEALRVLNGGSLEGMGKIDITAAQDAENHANTVYELNTGPTSRNMRVVLDMKAAMQLAGHSSSKHYLTERSDEVRSLQTLSAKPFDLGR